MPAGEDGGGRRRRRGLTPCRRRSPASAPRSASSRRRAGPCAALSRPTSLPLRQFSANLPFGFPAVRHRSQGRRTSRTFTSVFGGQVDDRGGHTVHDYLPRHGADRVQGALRQVLETGDAVTDMQLVGPAPGSSRNAACWSIALSRAQRFSGPADRHRRPRHGRDAPARRRPRGRRCARRGLARSERGGGPDRHSLDLETDRAGSSDVVRLLRPGLRRPVPGPARR
ncbi:PAS domain-containing protein [Streptomyces sp. KL116D]|uniref:PAS domain-containing protein n=1 Tax=Streptomyces sp. KL116D TaxID=3045152 RepID=UPI0035571939